MVTQPSIEILSPSHWHEAFDTIKILRPHLTLETFLSLSQTAHQQDQYEIAVVRQSHRISAAMGFRILFDLVHGKHLYIDDLVVDPTLRSQGIGRALLEFAEVQAKQQKCTGLRLSTGVENEGAIKFYKRNEWTLRSVTFKKKLTGG